MSKFFDETQKARQWPPQVSQTSHLDVVSVLDAIKQNETVAINVAEVTTP